MATKQKNTAKLAVGPPPQKRAYLKQTDVPSASLDEALRFPAAIFEHYAGQPTQPLFVAKALNVDPGGSQMILLSGAAIAYGLTEGGAQAATIAPTDLAKRILRPTEENSERAARREAVLKPRVFGEFLRKYSGNPLPREDIARNILEEMGVPRDKTADVLQRIVASAEAVGFIHSIRDKKYVSLDGANDGQKLGADDVSANDGAPQSADAGDNSGIGSHPPPPAAATQHRSALGSAIIDDERRRRVFVTHGKNRDLVDPIKKLLEYGELLPVVSVERQSVSKPVPEKVMDDMRSCGAAIIHVDADKTIQDQNGEDHVLLNPNVLIEIGAAMAFYGKRFVLLVREGVRLPSNLQGLYEVRYAGATLDATATIKLLESIKDMKNHALPTEKALTEQAA